MITRTSWGERERVDMYFPPLPLSKSLWKLSTNKKKWKVCRSSIIKKKKARRFKPLDAVCGEEGDGRAIVCAIPVVDMSSRLPMEQSRMVMMHASLFDCASCSQVLKPLTFKCLADGHVVCQDCRASHADADADAGCCIPCLDMDRMVRAAVVPCAHKHRGCFGPVPYYELADHLRSCHFAPPPPSFLVGNLEEEDPAKTAAAAFASGSPTTPAPATRPKRDRKPNPRYAGPSWIA